MYARYSFRRFRRIVQNRHPRPALQLLYHRSMWSQTLGISGSFPFECGRGLRENGHVIATEWT
jgi:hypothetical protein